MQFRLFYADYETFPICLCFVGGDWRKTFGVSCQSFIVKSISGISVANCVVVGLRSFNQNILHFPCLFVTRLGCKGLKCLPQPVRSYCFSMIWLQAQSSHSYNRYFTVIWLLWKYNHYPLYVMCFTTTHNISFDIWVLFTDQGWNIVFIRLMYDSKKSEYTWKKMHLKDLRTEWTEFTLWNWAKEN